MTYTIAAGRKPASKKEAAAIAQKILAGEPISDAEKESLFLYFAPRAGALKVRTVEQWVAQFAAVADRREYLEYLHSDGTTLRASDGHTAAWAPTTLPAGFYCPRTLAPVPNEHEWEYPDLARVIPKVSDEVPFRLEPGELSSNVAGTTVYEDSPAGYFDARYLERARKGGPCTVLTPSDGTSPMRGKCAMGEFVIMPCRR